MDTAASNGRKRTYYYADSAEREQHYNRYARPFPAQYDSAPQNEDEANAMSEAELRQFAVSFARQKNISASSLPLLDSHSDICPHSPPSPYTHPTSHVSSAKTSVTAHTSTESSEIYERGAMGYLQGCKRHRNNADLSASQQRMGIDLLLNASTLSDKMDCHKSPEPQESYHLMSPPMHSISPTVLPSISQLAQGYAAAATAPASEPYGRMSLSPPLPPVGAHPMSSPSESAFAAGSSGAYSLEAYRIGGSSGSKASRGSTGYSHANTLSHSFPPPVSDIRNMPGAGTLYGQHPTPPDSNYSSPTGVTPSQGPQCVSSRTGILSVPSSASMSLPPAGDVVVCPDLHHRSSYPVSPTSPPVYRTEARQHLHQPVSPEFTFSHPPPPPPAAQPSQIARSLHFHNIYTPPQGYYVGQPPSTHQPPPITIQQQHMSTAPVVVKNVSKPKFNYAFLDTKRPRGPSARWSAEEDILLKRAVKQFGEDRQWVKVSQQVPGRTNLQCRQRWLCNIKAQVEKERQQQQQQQQSAGH
ncbi:myb-like DNA-binding protein bas1 [Coemansia interrupta]|uniref:Myb-like DNA-binding protein bas1 n=1 Tax=Coemansia interrupta TaxID=1126814 RepID=A0A9W8HDE6_9FUNG|nr:myb-like DNA-binding protein bas1 [Coemansia interrupta]